MINFIELMYIVCDILNAMNEYRAYSAKKYPYGCYLDTCKDTHMLYTFHDYEKKTDILYSLSVVTGIDSKVLINAARIINKYEAACNWEKCFPTSEYERLVKGLMN